MFEKLVGNEKNKKLLWDSIKSNNIAHSYIFSGTNGIGKKLFAREYAKKIMCLDKENCEDICDSCIKFNSNNNPDFLEIEPDGKVIKIDQIRKMQEKIAEKPITSNKKTYIIDNADLMNEESQNCLLKTLEEPPEYAIIILVVSNESKLLPTIKSRCVTIKFNKIANSEMKEYLKNYTEQQIKLLDGSFTNIESIEKRQEEYESIKNIVEYMKKRNLVELMENSEILYKQKDDIMDILNCLNRVLIETSIIEPIKYVEKTKRKISLNNNYEMSIDYLLINSYNALRK